MRRLAPYIIPMLLVVDFVTLIIAVIVFFNQQGFNDRVHDGLCRSNGILVERVRADAKQSNPETFRTFFPDVSEVKIQAILAEQKAKTEKQIDDLSVGCTAAELGL